MTPFCRYDYLAKETLFHMSNLKHVYCSLSEFLMQAAGRVSNFDTIANFEAAPVSVHFTETMKPWNGNKMKLCD